MRGEKQPLTLWACLCAGIVICSLIMRFSNPGGTEESRGTKDPATVRSVARIDRFIENRVFGDFPPVFKALYRVQNEREFLGDGVRRIQVRMVVPKGLSKDILKANLLHATRTIYERSQSPAILVMAYQEGTDTTGVVTAASVHFAPNGNLGDATANTTLADCEPRIGFSRLYAFAASPMSAKQLRPLRRSTEPHYP